LERCMRLRADGVRLASGRTSARVLAHRQPGARRSGPEPGAQRAVAERDNRRRSNGVVSTAYCDLPGLRHGRLPDNTVTGHAPRSRWLFATTFARGQPSGKCTTGIWSQLWPSSSRPASLFSKRSISEPTTTSRRLGDVTDDSSVGFHAPHCFLKNATPAATHWSRKSRAHSRAVGRARRA
jgi:hypothetical protein